jgi:hypothetical protein
MAEKGRINAAELSQKLVNAKKVMSKVDNGDFSKGNINENIIKSSPEEVAQNMTAPSTPNTQTKKPAPYDLKKVQESKLPDAIKRAMIDNPIPQIGLDNSLDMDFVEKTRALMEQDGQFVPERNEPTAPSSPSTNYSSPQPSGDLETRLTPIIENVIRKTLEEIVDKKLNQILLAQESKSINEGLAIKVGDSIFTGKLTKVKSMK